MNEYTSEEIVDLFGFKRLVENWQRWRGKIRSKSRVRGFDFLVKWLPEKLPELLVDEFLAQVKQLGEKLLLV